MSDLQDRLVSLRPTIERLMRIGGTVGLSLGVLHQGKHVYSANYGYRNLDKKLPVTKDTIFPGCSLTKALTSAAIGLLVEDGKLSWDTLVKDVLPDYAIQSDILQNYTTVTDLLCHRTGMSRGDNLFIGTENNVLIDGSTRMQYLNTQFSLLPFRGQLEFSNLPYEIAGHIIEHLTGKVWHDIISTRILQPLGMQRTWFHTPDKGVENTASSYNVLDDATPTQITSVKMSDNGFGGACGGIRTCVSDLLKLYKTFLTTANHQFDTGLTSTKGSPSSKSIISWMMGQVGCNAPLLPQMPIVGKGGPSKLVVYHQGSFPGALASVNLVPDDETAIVILSNTLTLNDTPDWVGQLVLEEILNVSERNDYILHAEESVRANAKWYPTVIKELKHVQRLGTLPRDLQEYTGTYWDADRLFKIVVYTDSSTGLRWKLQGLDSEDWPLDHYDYDTFTWLRPRDELAKRGRWVDQGAEFWKVYFRGDGVINLLSWVHDDGVPPVLYHKT
ncbi:hypothetical protein FH972_023892 [Carpinus fangiana]|uniref:Beta-lactamase-related domain-containing protein n=1 Tax=Carpinus fangiana TaxID=176857 RepID=A0A5N6KX51_9ROSI|nr:hypothetical protein FH972_023892 [Carpinus fangiana]